MYKQTKILWAVIVIAIIGLLVFNATQIQAEKSKIIADLNPILGEGNFSVDRVVGNSATGRTGLDDGDDVRYIAVKKDGHWQFLTIFGDSLSCQFFKQKGVPASIYKTCRNVIFSNPGEGFTVLNYDDEGRPTEQMNLNDPACILNHTGPGPTEYIERLYYYTELEQGKIVLTTSCDGKLFTMTGAVNQVITYLHNPIDIETIFLEEDYNFDGYADFEAVRIADGGGGDYLNTTYLGDVYLYDPITKQFIFNNELSKLENLQIDSEKKYVQENLSYWTKPNEEIGVQGNEEIEVVQSYKWVDGHLVKVTQ